ncbi:MAG: hypothetical protein ACRC78_02670 [Planktothrix sp.]
MDGTRRFITLHTNDPGFLGTDNDVTFALTGSNNIEVTGWSFDPIGYDSQNDYWFTFNNNNITVTTSSLIASELKWITIRDLSNPLFRVPFIIPLEISIGDPINILANTLKIIIKNIGQNFAQQIVDVIVDTDLLQFGLGQLELRLFDSILLNDFTNEITGVGELNRLPLPSTFSQTGTDPLIYSYNGNGFFGIPLSDGSSRAFALFSSGQLVSIDRTVFSWDAGVPIGIQRDSLVYKII